MKNNWFSVDKEGLRHLIERHGKGRLVAELIQNALDENVSRIDIVLELEPGRPKARLSVTDDSPDGWRDLTHAYTLFAQSYKKGDPTKRGRFDLGEKLVLAMCDEAEITTTTGSVSFPKDGGPPKNGRKKRDRGSEFSAILKMTRQEFDEVSAYLQTLLIPEAAVVTYNGFALASRSPIGSFEARLRTEVADEEGIMRNKMRPTRIEVYEVLSGETPSLYEMGLPIVETGDKWHINVLQKVPDISFNRNNAPPPYIRDLRTLVANEMYSMLTDEDVGAGWVMQSLADKNLKSEPMEHILDLKFGKKRAARDPSDPEANKNFVAQGGTLIPGGTLSKEQWANAKNHGLIKPAGQICPSPKPYSDDPNADPANIVSEDKWSKGMKMIAGYSIYLARQLMGVDLTVNFVNTRNNFDACYGTNRLDFNLLRLSRMWFERDITEDVDELIIHEFGHHYSEDHLSSEYHDALCKLGAKLKRLAMEKPEEIRRFEE